MIQRLKKGFSRVGLRWILATGLLLYPVCGLTSDLTLSKAVETALSGNPGLQAAGFASLSAREKVLQARSGAMPQVQLTEQGTRTNNPMWAFGTRLNQETITTRDFDPARLNNPDSITNYATVFSVTWPVYDSGQTWYGLKQAHLNQEAAAFFADQTRHQVIAATISAYIKTLLAQENKVVLHQITETARAHLKLIQSRYTGGFVAKSDLLRAQVHIADLEQQLAEAGSRINIARCQLNVVMGVAPDFDGTLSTPLKPGDPIQGSLDSWISTALSNRPDLKNLTLQKRIAQKEIDKSRASRYPSVNLTGNYEIDSEDFQDSGTNYTIGAAVSMPLFTGGRISSRIREARINLKQTQTMLQGLEQQICGQIRQAFFNAQSAWERIQVAGSAIGQAEESLRIVRNRYDSGLFTLTDLLDVEDMVQQTRTNQLKAVHDYKAAAVSLYLAAGTIDRFK
ncbi:MAG: TolC family protein [Proteobacteria bacterium]|nr:TolC family protein [Pseudomonadota bacterium]MBU1583968.1 TolC family protein [Pseudomonadota bacterium]MBU2455353.1 TolC family protein [Pseudomonadota bacterium]